MSVAQPVIAANASLPNARVPCSARPATPADEAALFELLMALYDDNGQGVSVPVDEACVWEGARQACQMQGAVAAVIDGDHGDLAGSIGIFAWVPWYSKVCILNERWLFVRPEYRGRDYQDNLFRWAAQHRIEMSAAVGYDVPLFTSVMSEHRLPAKERLWGRYARKIGGLFLIDGGS